MPCFGAAAEGRYGKLWVLFIRLHRDKNALGGVNIALNTRVRIPPKASRLSKTTQESIQNGRT
ncbi:MAG: hypothetical protein EBV64_11505 [Oxalobacteraceae bacterium]|nr:hypothetical protein [Oxalobacteraceae bacterium]